MSTPQRRAKRREQMRAKTDPTLINSCRKRKKRRKRNPLSILLPKNDCEVLVDFIATAGLLVVLYVSYWLLWPCVSDLLSLK